MLDTTTVVSVSDEKEATSDGMSLDLARRSSAIVGSASSEKEAGGDKPESSKEKLGGEAN